ncbi:MAG: hypothetical protein QXP02_03075 [Desulfurococcaceae archaeon]
MACFITPLVIGVVVGILSKTSKSLRDKLKLNILAYMLIGGALILIAEHAWHGEIVTYPPFLTAMQNPIDVSVILHEIGISGGFMSLAVIATWFGALVFSRRLVLEVKALKKMITTFEP